MPSAPPTLTRRRLLTGALPATLAVGLLSGTAGCTPPPPPAELADLRTQFDRANADSLLAGEAATAPIGRTLTADMVATLTAIAAERTAHARALADEITRLTEGDVPTASAAPANSTGADAAPVAKPGVTAVATALRESGEDAARVATQMNGYRAGLLGSIAASCTAAYQVALGNPERKP
ncbi:hypothetical protein A7U43_19380 [Mycobacterium adipatum]|uniref:Tat pathway signal protein n=1 Tax=Mycobacterium adipatum TaxID=1682113 RepID=A0A172UVT1_9MYCO|nr:hypothetical protein [Mycobacterium adipatum]ANE83080.1 hypothetical protein A7U43_19380 [Mycobacterium adipatum]MBI5736427.1 hypothetical protein [Mycolicibacterium neoaurum]